MCVLLRLYNNEAVTYMAHFPMLIKLKKPIGNEITINNLEDLLRLARGEFARLNIDTQCYCELVLFMKCYT